MVVPVITLALGTILGGLIVAIPDVRLPRSAQTARPRWAGAPPAASYTPTMTARHAVLLLALALLVAGCEGPVAPANLIEVRNETTSSAHVEFVYQKGFLGIFGDRSVFDIPPGSSQLTATREATTLDITVAGEILHQPVTPARSCAEVLVELLPQGRARVSFVPVPGVCSGPASPAPSP